MRRTSYVPNINPYIALADMLINLTLIFALLLPLILLLGSRGWDESKYKRYQLQMEEAMEKALPASKRPIRQNRHDAPGEQRWTFNRIRMFETDSSTTLSEDGKTVLRKFAAVLNAHPELWWRIRVESHIPQDRDGYNADDEEASLRITAQRAIAVSAFLFRDPQCRIPPWKLTTSGRGHQDLLDAKHKASSVNERIDLLLIPPPVDTRGKDGKAGAAKGIPAN